MSLPAPDEDLIVEVTGGLVRGRRRGALQTWRGIAYAAPVSGSLRLRAPQPVHAWSGVRDAAEFGSDPFQQPGMGATVDRMSEDALTVNVTRRADGSSRPRPVLVFLYGGANIGGTSSYPLFGGAPFLEAEDIVYVTGNYRVGPFGFIDFSRYSTPTAPIDANLGLRDQLAILEWVHRNIAAFGGDPNNVTLAGQSAGALGVTTLMTVGAAAGLFHSAISQSSPVASVVSYERGADRAARVLAGLDADPADAARALTAVDAQTLMRVADQALASEQLETPGILSYSSTVDGTIVTEHPLDVLAAGRAHPVPLLIGTTDNEGTLFARQDKYSVHQVRTMLDRLAPDDRHRILDAYPGFPKPSQAAAIGGDFLFWAPSVQATEGHAMVAPVWMYRFDYATPLVKAMGLGATHGMDLMAIFGPENSVLGRKAHVLGGGRSLRAVAATTQRTWMDQVTRHEQSWERYAVPSRATRIIASAPTTVRDPRTQRRQAWEQFPFYR